MTRLLLAMGIAAICVAGDKDRDGLPDSYEDKLLRQFAPRFLIATEDCDAAPAEFAAGERAPRVVGRTGAIYGQAFPKGDFVELHFYHLWARDCGRASHALDVEHVSALVERKPARAVYWYAASHEGTLCDASAGARARDLRAEERGPEIWVSEGKHASFLSEEACRGGCGGDRCSRGREFAPARVINIGEKSFPLNGADWTSSAAWPLEAKMQSDFDRKTIARLEAGAGTVNLSPSPLALRKVMFGGVTMFAALAEADRQTSLALEKSDLTASDAVRESFASTGRFLRRMKAKVKAKLSAE